MRKLESKIQIIIFDTRSDNQQCLHKIIHEVYIKGKLSKLAPKLAFQSFRYYFITFPSPLHIFRPSYEPNSVETAFIEQGADQATVWDLKLTIS